MSFPPPITGLKLRISTGADSYEQPIPSASLGNNSMQIMPNTVVFNAFVNNPPGTIFTPSMVTSYGSDELGNAVSMVSTPSVIANFIAIQIIPNLSLANIPNKLTTDSPFSLSVTTNSGGVLSYSSSAPSVATVNSSGLVTIVGAGTTTITVNLAASANGQFAAASVTRLLVVSEQWRQLGADIDGEAQMDESGSSVSISSDGTIVAIGSDGNNGNGTSSGHVRVYTRDANKTTAVTDQNSSNFGPVGWTRLGGDIDGEAEEDQSGRPVCLSSDGTTVAIGAIGNNGNGTSSGHVRVYKRDTNKTTAVTDQSSSNFGPVGWRRLGGDIDGEAAEDQSGTSVSLSSDGTTLAIGAIGNDGNGTDSGHVRVYKYIQDTNTWVKQGNNIDGEAASDNSGVSVSLSSNGTIVAIGAVFNDGNGSNSGHVRVYIRDTSVALGWRRLGADIVGKAAGDNSGISVSLSSDGTTLAIGAIKNDGNGDNSGNVRVYKYIQDTNTWVQQGGDIDGEGAGDWSGRSVSLSSDGTTLAIGATDNDGNGTDSGHVRVYTRDANKTTAVTDQSSSNFGPVGWRRLGADIDGEAAEDWSGISVSLSSDGTTVAIGSDGNSGNGFSSGNVRVYKLESVYKLE
jgi:hypothetical protein